jgi:Fe-S-cluster containining protein
MGRILRLYEQHAADWDAEFRRVRDEFPGRLQCHRGCSRCCSQLFSISWLEAAVIGQAVAALPGLDRRRLQASARSYLEGACELGIVDEVDGEPSVSPRPGLRLPCPALQDDACSIYAARPIICRKWGVPVFDPSKPDRLHACELNFREGESVDAGGIVGRQSVLLEAWVEVKERSAAELQPSRLSWTIAEAILAVAADDE